MLCQAIAALRLFLSAHASLFLLQFRTSNVSSPFIRGAKNAGLAAATAILGNPNGEQSDSDVTWFASDENAEKKTSLELDPTGGSIELKANMPRTSAVVGEWSERTLGVAAAGDKVVVWRWGGWMPLSQRTRAMREERLGSYSILSTTPKEEAVLRLRSMVRCNRRPCGKKLCGRRSWRFQT